MSGTTSDPSSPAPITTSPIPDITEATYQVVVKFFAGTVCMVLLMIVGVLCFRVALDGDSAITQQITQQLAGLVPWLAGALVAAIVGAKGAAALLSNKS